MKKNCFILLVAFLVVSCAGGEGVLGEPCRSPDDRLEPCNGGLECGADNICEECGGDGQICCDSEYYDACHSSLTCGEDGRCSRCGAENTPCCAKGWCKSRLFCGTDNICESCGYGDGQTCCEGAYCYGGLSCVEGACASQVCGEDGSCQPCGRIIGEPCCAGGTCAANSTCGGEGVCVACGALDEPACINKMCGYWKRDIETDSYTPCACDAWFANVGGVCSDPFKADPQTDVEVCGIARMNDKIVDPPSSTDIEDGGWCYWYAAYYKNDLAYCENIMWGEMKTKCAEGENPEEYFSIITVE
jgi:hypothetical protein